MSSSLQFSSVRSVVIILVILAGYILLCIFLLYRTVPVDNSMTTPASATISGGAGSSDEMSDDSAA